MNQKKKKVKNFYTGDIFKSNTYTKRKPERNIKITRRVKIVKGKVVRIDRSFYNRQTENSRSYGTGTEKTFLF